MKHFTIENGERIAQLVIAKHEKGTALETRWGAYQKTSRGEGEALAVQGLK